MVIVHPGESSGQLPLRRRRGHSFSVAAHGALTQLGAADCREQQFRLPRHCGLADGKFFYTTDDDKVVHAFSVDRTTGAIAELSVSPYSPGGEGQIVADLTGKFVYMGDQENTGQVIGYTRDMTTGALTIIGGTTTAKRRDSPLVSFVSAANFKYTSRQSDFGLIFAQIPGWLLTTSILFQERDRTKAQPTSVTWPAFSAG